MLNIQHSTKHSLVANRQIHMIENQFLGNLRLASWLKIGIDKQTKYTFMAVTFWGTIRAEESDT